MLNWARLGFERVSPGGTECDYSAIDIQKWNCSGPVGRDDSESADWSVGSANGTRPASETRMPRPRTRGGDSKIRSRSFLFVSSSIATEEEREESNATIETVSIKFEHFNSIDGWLSVAYRHQLSVSRCCVASYRPRKSIGKRKQSCRFIRSILVDGNSVKLGNHRKRTK